MMKKVKKFLELFHSHRKKQRPHNRNVLCWSFFYVNDDGEMTLDAFQIMCHKLCYCNHMFSFNSRIKLRKVLIYLIITLEIICLKNMLMQTIQFLKENLKRKFKMATCFKKNQIYLVHPFMIFLPPKSRSKRMMWSCKSLWICSLIIKNHLPL